MVDVPTFRATVRAVGMQAIRVRPALIRCFRLAPLVGCIGAAPLAGFSALGETAPLSASAGWPRVSDTARAPEMRLGGDVVTMPITMVREFPFVEGEIAGVRGKFMLDTGMRDAIVVNDHRVPIAGGTTIGTGHFGSVQSYEVRLHSKVREVSVAGRRYPVVTQVRSQDARMLEKITPDFLGWVGYDFFSRYALKLDYRHLRATFYNDGGERFLAGETVVAVLPFETRKLPNIPVMRARIGRMNVIATLDTGMYGSLSISPEMRRRLLGEGHLKPTRRPDVFDLTHILVGDKVKITARSIEVEEGRSASATAVGVVEDTELELGFVFLRQYKTVWDYQRKRLYLLAR